MWGLWYTDIKITMVNMLRALLEKVNHERIDEYYKKRYGNSKKELKGNDRNRKTKKIKNSFDRFISIWHGWEKNQ